MAVEVLGADLTPKQVEANEDKVTFPSEMNGKAKEGDRLENSNIPKDAVDEWPAPTQIHTFYFIRVRSYENPQLKTEITKAEADLKKKMDTRSEIIEQLKEKRAVKSKLKSELQPFLAENKKYKIALEEKRNEIKPLQENMQKHRAANNAAREKGMGLCSSEEELNDLIQSLHYRIQHESNTLNEEKQLLKEIKQLEATREKVIANVSMKAEIEKSKGEKAETQEKMKLLGINMDEVRKEKQAVMNQIKQIDEKLKDIDKDIELLEDKLKVATERKDSAFETLNSMKKRRDEVNTCFYQNRSLLNKAKELAAEKDITGLDELSNKEVEKFMTQWSSNKAFRDDYERRILSSLNSRQLSRDGRIRNPDEKPIFVESAPAEQRVKVTPDQGNEATKPPSSEDAVPSIKNRGAELTKSANKPESGRKISNKEETADTQEETIKELPKREEVDPAKLKEMKREAEIAKAKLAMERKKRLAEKAAAKAEARAQKEAEKKLKQKEKKAKKKTGTTEPALSAEETEAETKGEKSEESDVNADNPISEEGKPKKVNVPYRNKVRAKEQLPRAILKRKKSHSYGYWAVPAAILSVLLAIAGYYYSGRF